MLKQVRFGLVLTNSEKAVVEYLAEVDGGLSQAAVIRRLIRAEAKRQGLLLPAQQAQPDAARQALR